MKKVNLHIVFLKKWILKTSCNKEDIVSSYLKRVLKDKITINNNKITSLFNIKTNSMFCWLILDSKRNLLKLSSLVPKKIIIIGIDLKTFYTKISKILNTNQVRMLNSYLKELYGFVLYDDMLEEQVISEPLNDFIVNEVIKPAVIEKLPKIEKSAEKDKANNDSMTSFANIQQNIEKDLFKEEKKSVKKEKKPKEERAVLEKVERLKEEKKSKKEVNNKDISKSEEKKVAKLDVHKDKKEVEPKPKKGVKVTKDELSKLVVESTDNIKKKDKSKEESNQPKEKGLDTKKVKKTEEPKPKKDIEEKGEVKVQNRAKKKEIEPLKDKNTEVKKQEKPKLEKPKPKNAVEDQKKKNESENQKMQDTPEEIQIVLNLPSSKSENQSLDSQKDNDSKIVVTSSNTIAKDFDDNTDKNENIENKIQRITFTVVLPTGEVLYSKVILNSTPMTVEELLKKTGLPIKDDLGFIESIAGINNQGMSGWVYEVNGAPIMVSASDYVVNPEDEITWKYINFDPIDLPLEEDQNLTVEEFVEEPVGKKMR